MKQAAKKKEEGGDRLNFFSLIIGLALGSALAVFLTITISEIRDRWKKIKALESEVRQIKDNYRYDLASYPVVRRKVDILWDEVNPDPKKHKGGEA